VKVYRLFLPQLLKCFEIYSFLKSGTAPWPDGIQATILKHASESLDLPLAQLHQSLFNSSEIPKEWKLAMVTPVFKKDNLQM